MTVAAPERGIFPSWSLSTCPSRYQHEYFKGCGFYGHSQNSFDQFSHLIVFFRAWFLLSSEGKSDRNFVLRKNFSWKGLTRSFWQFHRSCLALWWPRQRVKKKPVMDKARLCIVVMTWYDNCLDVRTFLFAEGFMGKYQEVKLDWIFVSFWDCKRGLGLMGFWGDFQCWFCQYLELNGWACFDRLRRVLIEWEGQWPIEVKKNRFFNLRMKI